MEETALVEASQRGDRVAFGSLVDLYYKSIYRLAFHFSGNHDEADDVCQETFLRAYGNIHKLREGDRFQAWIYTIATNLLRKRAKKRKSNIGLCDDVMNQRVHSVDSGPDADPSKSMVAEENATVIQQQLQIMPQDMRLATILVLMENVPQKSVAAVLNCSEATVSRHLDRSREWLRNKLRDMV